MSIHKIKSGKTLIVEGPARIVVDEGELTLIGAPIRQGDAIVIKKSRHVAMEGATDSTLKISLGASAHVDLLNTSSIPLEWKELAETLNKHILPFCAVFFGDVDTGKTTFVTYLANLFYQWGKKTAILSTDLGQGFPGLITLYQLETPIIDMAEITPTDAFFVGSTTPDCFENRVMIGSEAMLKKAESLGIEALFVDTTGWVYGFKARELKKSLIQLIQPDLLIVVERERELEHLIRPFLNSTKVHRMPVSPKIRYRDRTDRKFLRESMLSKQLSGSDTITFHFKEVSFLNSFLNTGEIVSGPLSEKICEIVGYVPKYVELCQDAILIAEDPETPLSENMIEKFQEEFPHLPIQIINAKIIENVLVGLIDLQNTFLGYGVITNIDFFKHLITIYTPVSKEHIASIQFGSFKVTQDGQELCWIHPWTF
ncbi:Clp1/GlmU family protein [Candidatus Borrarchaeum sp.]|uniref:Clp1/GlmU family protein n=1 Tax=Candidatus Borrarchaeum sp. TaxID=2846742 RepID=UPI00257E7F04|nr:Clp1/GlmU family protein [Candidatus Borrarchaeum sp.]